MSVSRLQTQSRCVSLCDRVVSPHRWIFQCTDAVNITKLQHSPLKCTHTHRRHTHSLYVKMGSEPTASWLQVQCPYHYTTTPPTDILPVHPFNGLFPVQPGQAGTRKVNHSGFYWSKRWWGGSGISWTICKSFAPRSRQMTTPVPHHSVFTGRMPFLPPNQQRQSTEGIIGYSVPWKLGQNKIRW